MEIQTITFENYKAFSEPQTLELRPITILIGKNSSGKSAIAKLFTMLENSLSKLIEEPLLLKNNGVELGGEFKDLVYGQQDNDPIKIKLNFSNGVEIFASIIQVTSEFKLTILEWGYKDSSNNFKIEYSPQNGYMNDLGDTFTCEFRGILPVKVIDKDGYNLVENFMLNVKLDIDYIGPFRVLPQRKFYLTNQLDFSDTGDKGQNAYDMLGVSKIMKNELHLKVGEWYKDNFDGWELLVDDKDRPYVQVLLSKDGNSINIVDVGQGMNQVLPLVTRAHVHRENSIIVLEQPELHLHPAAHADLAELFAKSSKDYNQRFLIETHAENILLRLRKIVINNDFGFSKDDVIIYWVNDAESKGQQIDPITINENGVLSDWPEGVFSEDVTEILNIKKTLRDKKLQG